MQAISEQNSSDGPSPATQFNPLLQAEKHDTIPNSSPPPIDIPSTIRAIKSVKQNYAPTKEVLELMTTFRLMVNDAIRIGLEHDASTLRRLCNLTYKSLSRYDCLSYYKLCAISKAAGTLSARKKSIRRGFPAKTPYITRHVLASCYGFKIEDGKLRLPLGEKKFEYIQLNGHTLRILADPDVKVRSFTLTETSLSLCISKEVQMMRDEDLTGTIGIDRNERNLTVGNHERIIFYGMDKVVEIGETTRSIIRSFKRNDVRIRRALSLKYGERNRNRIRQILNRVTKMIVHRAKAEKKAVVFEDIEGIRKLYRKGNGQGRRFRGRMNSWPYQEAKKQTEYKAAWEGVRAITLTKGETRGTTMDCPRCGERLQSAA
jgi:putative transposase